MQGASAAFGKGLVLTFFRKLEPRRGSENGRRESLEKQQRRTMEMEGMPPDLCNVVVMTLDVFEMRLGW